MKEAITVKPIFWRLVIGKGTPILIGGMIASFIPFPWANPYSSLYFYLPESALAILTGVIICSVIFRRKFDIVISDGKINGPGTGNNILSREAFAISDLDTSNIHKQSFYEKISGFHTLRSLNGQKITFMDFIYGKLAVDQIYKILEQQHSQSTK